jgi:hypothetical protein
MAEEFMAEEFPLWVREEAARRMNAETDGAGWRADTVLLWDISRALCRLIAETMPEPVDPDLIEAREFCAAAYGGQAGEISSKVPSEIRQGMWDKSYGVRASLAALKSRPRQ